MASPCTSLRSASQTFNNAGTQRSNKLGRLRTHASAQKKQDVSTPPQQPQTGVGLKAAWLGAEQFGKLVSLGKRQQQQQQQPPQAVPQAQQRMSREDALAAIREDFDSVYFVSGVGEMRAFDENCYYADPFAGFAGTKRFQTNVRNLGGLLRDVRLDLTDWQEGEDSLQTKWRFSAILEGLPWRPILAAAGGTKFVFSKETGLVVQHIESWDVEPAAVLRQLLKPAAKVPTSQWEVVMSSVYSGDVAGIWLALSRPVVILTAAALPLSLVWHAVSGTAANAGDAVALAGLLAGLASELSKLLGGVSGGEL